MIYRRNLIRKTLWSVAVITLPALVQAQVRNAKYAFGTSEVPKGYTLVTPETKYSDKQGYGLDFDGATHIVSNGKSSKMGGSFITADKPFFFSVNVAEGNYKVTVTLGDNKGASTTTVKAESRRLMLEHVETENGKLEKRSFIVNVRRPEITGGNRVKLKDREVTKLDWDNKLTLEFNDARPCVDAIEIEKVEDQVTVYLAGNSTVVDQGAEPWASWGQMIPRFFKPGVAIANHAESGLTLNSFLGSNRLDKILSTIKPGDYLFVEFGHNDQKEKGENAGAYKGYTERLKLYISKVKEKGGIPVIVTSTARRSFDEKGKSKNTLGDFPEAARKVAADEKVALIDLNEMTTRLYDALGEEPSKKAFVFYPANTFPGQDKALADNTHFCSYGAYELAKCMILGIKASHLGIEKFIVDFPAFDPAHPDPAAQFKLPPSPDNSVVKPDGN